MIIMFLSIKVIVKCPSTTSMKLENIKKKETKMTKKWALKYPCMYPLNLKLSMLLGDQYSVGRWVFLKHTTETGLEVD